jgi:hypothetical protein
MADDAADHGLNRRKLKFPFPRFPIWPGNEKGTPDSRLGRNRESGNPPFPDSAGTRKRETGPRWPQIGKSGETLRV